METLNLLPLMYFTNGVLKSEKKNKIEKRRTFTDLSVAMITLRMQHVT